MYSLERKGGTLILHMSEELDHHMAVEPGKPYS